MKPGPAMHMPKYLMTLAVVASLVQTPPAVSMPAATPAATPDAIPDAMNARLDAFLRARVEAGDVPGVVAMVVDAKSTLYLGAAGKADVARNRPMTPDSIFRIASMTKPVT